MVSHLSQTVPRVACARTRVVRTLGARCLYGRVPTEKPQAVFRTELVCCRQATALGGLYNVRACRRYVLHVRHTLWRAAWYRMHVIAHRSPARSELGCGAPSAVLQKPAVRP